MNSKPKIWLDEMEYKKAIGQLRLQMNAVFEPFDKYGLGIFIPGAIEEAMKLTEDFGLRVRGVDKPLDIDRIRNRRNTK